MKRAGWYLMAGAVAGFGGVLGLHSGQGATQPPQSEIGPLPTESAPASGPTAGPASGRTPTATPGPTGAGTGQARSATGAVVNYGYGQLSVTVTVHGSEVTAVSVPVLNVAEPYSQQLAAQVIPMLRSEVLAAHSARIQAVSGATYTSEAYAESIQSALDKLHVR